MARRKKADEKTFQYTFENGTTVNLKKVSKFVYSTLMVDTASKVPVPMTETKIGMGKHAKVKLIPNYNDETYQEVYLSKQRQDSMDQLRNFIVVGIVDEVPKDEYEYFYDMVYMSKGDETTDQDIKFYWILNQMESDHEFSDFQEAVMGVSQPTEGGIEDSIETFPSKD